MWVWVTPEFLSKKHLNFGQGLEFLKFGQGNRGPNQQNRRKAKEHIRKSKEKQRQLDKTIRVRDPYFLLKHFLFNIFSVLVAPRLEANSAQKEALLESADRWSDRSRGGAHIIYTQNLIVVGFREVNSKTMTLKL